MKLNKISCPNCGGVIKSDIKDRTFVFCNYCGYQIEVDREINETIFTNNINIHNRYTNDAEVIHEQNEYKLKISENKISLIILAIILTIAIIPPIYLFIINPIAAKCQGKISAGNYYDYVDKDYKTVKATLKGAGFTNIEVIDRNDYGLLFWQDDEVTSVSIGGNSKFESTDYFKKNAKVVITHH